MNKNHNSLSSMLLYWRSVVGLSSSSDSELLLLLSDSSGLSAKLLLSVSDNMSLSCVAVLNSVEIAAASESSGTSAELYAFFKI